MDDWKSDAEFFYYGEHRTIHYICRKLGISKPTMLKFIKSFDKYGAENQFRRNETKRRQKEAKEDWKDKNRHDLHFKINGDSIRREHFEAVNILSHEIF